MVFFAKIVSGIIFNFLGIVFLFKSIETTRNEGIGTGILEIFGGLAFITIGILIFLGFIS